MKKYRVGYTAGAFDLFHIGHLNLLRNAKRQVDRLIVGVSVDYLIQTYKKRGPVIPFEERIEIVRSIKFVDDVCPQENLDKLEAWNTLGFDSLFVGSDWKDHISWVEYERRLESVGVPVIYLPYTEVTNSSLLRATLEELNK